MRSVLVLGLLGLVIACASADAKTVHHFRTRHHVTIQPRQNVCAPPVCYKFPGYPPLPRNAVNTLDESTAGGP